VSLHPAILAVAGEKRDAYALAVAAEEAFVRGDRQGTLDALEEAKQAGPPGLVTVPLLAAELFHAERFWTHAIASASEVLRNYPRLPRVLNWRGSSRLLTFDAQGALEDFEAYRDTDPDSYEPLLGSLFAADLAGSYEKELALAERAAKVQHDSLALFLRGAALEGLGRAAEAKGSFEDSLRNDLWCARAHLGLARIALDRDDLPTAHAEWAVAKQCFAHEPGYNREPLNVEAFLRTLVHAGAAIQDRDQAIRCREAVEPYYPEGLPPKLAQLLAQLGL
jgi:tetratricopeptide (TPR) repeat protein